MRQNLLMNGVAAPRMIPALHTRTAALNNAALSENMLAIYAGLFFASHVLLAVLIHSSKRVGTLHSILTLAVGACLVCFSRRGIEYCAYVVAYITGSEVLWRMTGAGISWEQGKYSVAAIILIAIVRWRLMKGPASALLYFLLLLPSTLFTVSALSLGEARRDLSFNLSGPLALMFSIWFFSQLQFTTKQLKVLFVALTGPIIGVAFLTIFFSVTSESIYFGSNSNAIVTGGFGPNQVSAALGLGALVALLSVLIGRSDHKFKVLLLCVAIMTATQSALTFSRGGLYNALAGVALALVWLSRDSKARTRIFFVAAVMIITGVFVVLPYLNSFTSGALSRRFASFGTTGRTEIVEDDINTWVENPILGVGPGQAAYYRPFEREGVPAHTELSRLLAEHGLLGLLAMLLLIVSITRRWRSLKSAEGKAFVAAAAGWSFLYMLSAGMRLTAPSLMLGLCFVMFTTDPSGKLRRGPIRRLRRSRSSVSN